MAPTPSDDSLNDILKKITASPGQPLASEEVSQLISAFANAAIRPRAYVVLSAFCQSVRSSKKDAGEASRFNAELFGTPVSDKLAETNEPDLLVGIAFLIALFQVDPQAGSLIFSRNEVIENLVDTIEISPSNTLSQEVAHLLGQASGQKSCRPLITPQVLRWLEFKTKQAGDPVLQAAAVVAFVKLARGSAADGPESGSPAVALDDPKSLAEILSGITSSSIKQAQLDAVEGLAYLSIDPGVKELLSNTPTFLKRLFSLVPKKKTGSALSHEDTIPVLVYGILVIVRNLVSYRPQLTEEQQQVEKLKQITKPAQGATKPNPNPVEDSDDFVKKRITKLIDAGVLSVFPAALSISDSEGTRDVIGASLLAVVEEKSNRGKVLQTGGSKVLQTVIKQSLGDASGQGEKVAPSALASIQALAKLAITSSPVQVFGPNAGAIYDAIRPFSILLQHPLSTLLQRFEAIMALTNLAAENQQVASRVAKAEGLVNKVELMLLEDHTLVRRASMELICNLIAGSDDVFERYGDQLNARSKVHILLALSDVDDLPTRLAASGALATVTAAPQAAQHVLSLQQERQRFLPIMAQLIDPEIMEATDENGQPLPADPGLAHRAVVCLSNVVLNIKDNKTRDLISAQAKESRLCQALNRLIKGQGVIKDPQVLQQAAVVSKVLGCS